MNWELAFITGFVISYLFLILSAKSGLDDDYPRETLRNWGVIALALSGIVTLSAVIIKYGWWVFGGAW